jgi:PAS domain S-box-containing protein
MNEKLALSNEIRNSWVKYDGLFDIAPYGVFIIDLSGKIIFASKMSASRLGKTTNEIIGTNLTDYFPSDIAENRRLKGIDAINSGISQSIEDKVGDRWYFSKIIPLKDKYEKITSLAIFSDDITERKLAEEALRKSEERFSLAMEASKDGIWDWDLTTGDIYCSPSLTFMLGYDSTDVIKNVAGWQDLIHPEDRQKAYQVNIDCVNNITDSFEIEYRMKTIDGGWKWISGRGRAVYRDDTGRALRMTGTHQDITERKRTKEALQKSEEQFRNLYDNAPVGYFEYDLRGNITRVNLTHSKLLGYTAEEMIGQPCWKFIVDEVAREQILDKLRGVRPPAVGLERTYRRKDGTTFPVLFEDRLLKNEDGHITGIRTAIQDITARKEAEQLLHISEKRVRAKLDAVLCPEGDISRLDLVDIIDKTTIQQLMDDFYQLTNIGGAILNLDGNVVASAGWREICAQFHRKHPVALENCIESDTKLTENIEPGRIKKYRCKNNMWDIAMPIYVGDNLFGNLFIGQFFYEDEEINYDVFRFQAHKFGFNEKAYMDALDRVPVFSRNAVEIAMNYYSRLVEMISTLSYSNLKLARTYEEHKQNERAREKLQTQLNQAQKMESVGRLAGGVAHDFNNMLGIILGHTELALLKTDKDNDLVSDLNEIQKAAKRSADITKQLLAFARKDIISPKQLDLNDTVESMLNMLRRLIGEDIDLVWQPVSHLWPVKMDPSQIDQILVNLCVNARDAIAGVGKLTIETGRHTFDQEYCNEHPGFIPGDFVLLAVSDNGCGMDKETLDNLFEPFFTTKDVGKGTGLGLATIYGIVKQNNGFINVYSEPGQGSTFKIYLPRLVTDEDVDKAVPEKKAAAGGTETILLVEDESTILRMTRMMLERKGYTVLSAATPAEAMEKAKIHSSAIDLLMTDVVMPEMNGRDLAGQITALYPDIRLLFMSGYTADVIAHQGVLDDGVAFIQKPFSMADMTVKVREVLDKASDETQ